MLIKPVFKRRINPTKFTKIKKSPLVIVQQANGMVQIKTQIIVSLVRYHTSAIEPR